MCSTRTSTAMHRSALIPLKGSVAENKKNSTDVRLNLPRSIYELMQ
jgi:hypothetical protein